MDRLHIADLALKFTEDVDAMLKTSDTFVRFLPPWISSRLISIEYLKESPPSFRNLSSIVSTVAKIGDTVQRAACHSELSAVCGTVGFVITLGIYKGCKTGLNDFNNRRLNNVLGEFEKDYPETKYVVKLVKKLSENLNEVARDLEELTGALSSDRDDLSPGVQQEIDSIRAELPDGYKFFLEWSLQIQQLLENFLTILEESMKPSSQISSLLNRSKSREVVLDKDDILEWIKTLQKCLAAVETANKDALGNVSSANNLLTTMSEMTSISTLLSTVSSGLSTNGQVSSVNGSCSQVSDLDLDQNYTHEIDEWFRQILHLYTHSIDVAREVHRLLSKNKEIARNYLRERN